MREKISKFAWKWIRLFAEKQKKVGQRDGERGIKKRRSKFEDKWFLNRRKKSIWGDEIVEVKISKTNKKLAIAFLVWMGGNTLERNVTHAIKHFKQIQHYSNRSEQSEY